MDFKGLTVHIEWPNLLPIDDQAAAQTAVLLQQIGISTETLIGELGYDPDLEADKVANEQDMKAKQAAKFAAKAPKVPAAAAAAAGGGANAPLPGEQIPMDGQTQAQQQRNNPGPPKNHPAAVAARNALTAAVGKNPKG